MIGVLCGLRSEARVADKICDVLVACSGARPEQAERLARHMVEKGVKRLISFGLAGAVSPHLEAGDLVLGATVLSAHGEWVTDSEWNDRMMVSGPCFLSAPVWGSKRLVSSLEEKDAICRRAACMIVDMESHIVAEVATKAGIHFNIVRAVADTSDMILPPAAQVPLKMDGAVDFRAVFSSIFHDPKQLPDLIALGQNTSRAMTSLRAAVHAIKEVEKSD